MAYVWRLREISCDNNNNNNYNIMFYIRLLINFETCNNNINNHQVVTNKKTDNNITSIPVTAEVNK